jgi:hypothetical protein
MSGGYPINLGWYTKVGHCLSLYIRIRTLFFILTVQRYLRGVLQIIREKQWLKNGPRNLMNYQNSREHT